MATAIVTGNRDAGSGGAGGAPSFIIVASFLGTDVPESADGQSYYIDILLQSGYSIADMKAKIVANVVATGSALGLTVLNTDVNLPVFERGT